MPKKKSKKVKKNGNDIPHLLKLNIIFKNPNTNIKDIIIKFNYVIESIGELPTDYVENTVIHTR